MNGKLEFAPFQRQLRTPFAYGTQLIEVRRGFILHDLETGFFSEASPLPSHSKETFEDILHRLSIPLKSKVMVPPSLRCALEALEVQKRKGNFPVQSNALLPEGNAESLRAALSAFEREGYKVCKMKISPEGWEQQLSLVDEFSAFRFRLDANRTLSPKILTSLLGKLHTRGIASRIEYIEEPFADFWKTKSFRDAPVKFAADESSSSLEDALQLLEQPHPPDVFIVKPMVYGGLNLLEELVSKLGALKIVITSTLETEVGRRALLHYLSQGAHEVSGVSTGFLFEENFLADQPLWSQIPEISEMERAHLKNLRWKPVL